MPANPNPANRLYTITPSDTVSFAQGPCAGLYVGVTGDVTVLANSEAGQATVLLKAMPVGTHPIGCLRVNATGTTATNLVALYN